MANKVVITKIVEGDRHAIFHVFIESDGASGDIVDEVLIDPESDLSPALNHVPSLTIEQLWYDLSGFNAKLEFDYLTEDTPVWTLSSGNAVHMDFNHLGGLKDRSNELDGTGKLTITTNGLATSGDNGTIVIKVRKN